VVFIIILLLLIFRAALAPLITLVPAFIAITIAGPLVAEAAQAGLKVSQLAQILLIVLVLGAGTDYGLFLVFRVREQLRGGMEPREAVITSLTRVGESITFSAATVIAALLADLALLPALLAIFGRAAFWPSKTREGTGKRGVRARAAVRITRHPAIILVTGLVIFGALAVVSLGYKGAGFGGETNAPAHSDSAAGQTWLTKYFPRSTANPTNVIFKLKQPAWEDGAVLARASQELSSSGLFTEITGPLDPTGYALTPAQYAAVMTRIREEARTLTLGEAARWPLPGPRSHRPAWCWPAHSGCSRWSVPAPRAAASSSTWRSGWPWAS
jgi:putative drug exporter of the RND superfamily